MIPPAGDTDGRPAPPDQTHDDRVAFADGQRIFAEGQISDVAYIVVSGTVELSKADPEGAMRLAVLGPGELFGEMGLLDGSVRSASAVARGATVLRRLDHDLLFAALRQRPEAMLGMAMTIAKRLRHADSLIARPDRVGPDRGRGPLRSRLRRLWRPAAIDLDRVRIEFKPDAIEIEERPLPLGTKALLHAIIALVICGTVWASLARIDRVVVASGRIVTTSARIVVQPMAAATVRAIHVRVGEIVAPDQVLVSLDHTFTEADEQSVRAQMQGAAAEIRRLEAELALASGGNAPPGPFAEDHAEQAVQTEIFTRHQAERMTMIRTAEAEIRELETHLAAVRMDRADAQKQLGMSERLERIRHQLFSDGNGSLINLLDAQRQLTADQRDFDRLSNELVETTGKIETVKARLAANLSTISAKRAEELEAARREFGKAAEQIKKQERLSVLGELRSPAKAMVLELGARSVGSVVKDGEMMATLVPLDVPVEIEGLVDPKDIGYLRVGDSARIKLDAFPYQKYGTLEAVVRAINGDVIEQETGNRKVSVYKVLLSITHNGLHDLPKDAIPLPGMAAQAEIKVGTRRLITFVLYPIVQTLDSGLRDP